MKIFANVEIRSSGPSAGSNAIELQKQLAAGLDIKVLGFSAAEFDLVFDTPAEVMAVVAALERFFIEESRTAFPFPLLPSELERRSL
jgi:hypothetical protein